MKPRNPLTVLAVALLMSGCSSTPLFDRDNQPTVGSLVKTDWPTVPLREVPPGADMEAAVTGPDPSPPHARRKDAAMSADGKEYRVRRWNLIVSSGGLGLGR